MNKRPPLCWVKNRKHEKRRKDKKTSGGGELQWPLCLMIPASFFLFLFNFIQCSLITCYSCCLSLLCGLITAGTERSLSGETDVLQSFSPRWSVFFFRDEASEGLWSEVTFEPIINHLSVSVQLYLIFSNVIYGLFNVPMYGVGVPRLCKSVIWFIFWFWFSWILVLFFSTDDSRCLDL